MPERYQQIMGTELEWALSVKMQSQSGFQQLSDDVGTLCKEYLPDDVIRITSSSNSALGMMSNGSRYYVDVGAHLEYATPENITPEGVVISELGSERLIAECLRRYVANRNGVEAAVMQKRIIDDNLQIWGYHINISEDRRSMNNDFEKFVQPLIVHYAASVPLFGAGAVVNMRVDGEKKRVYSYGQKVLGLTSSISGGTTYNSKPIINTRDEPLANMEKHRRMHIVGNDPHISPWAARMTIGTYSLILSAARQKKLPLIESEMPEWQMAQRVAGDLDCRLAYAMKINGHAQRMTIIDIEREYIKAVKKLDDLTPDQARDLEEWEKAIDDLERDVMSLRYRSDGIAKLALIRAKLARDQKGENEFDASSANIDKDYTVVFRATKKEALSTDVTTLMNNTTAARLRQRWFAQDMPPEDQIADAVVNPPTTTRAYQRGNAIRSGAVTSADWGSYKLNDLSIVKLQPLEGAKSPE